MIDGMDGWLVACLDVSAATIACGATMRGKAVNGAEADKQHHPGARPELRHWPVEPMRLG